MENLNYNFCVCALHATFVDSAVKWYNRFARDCDALCFSITVLFCRERRKSHQQYFVILFPNIFRKCGKICM